MSVIIYPAYFNINYSRAQGRRVPKNLSFEPKLETITKVLKDLGYDFEVEPDKKYPRFWWKDQGRVIVHAEEKKNQLIIKIARKVRNI